MINQQITSTWERRLLNIAVEAMETHTIQEPLSADQSILQKAYDHCEEITRQHSRTFYIASGFLPEEKKRAARALYAFCRVSDDLIDRNDKLSEADLDEWRSKALASQPPQDEWVSLAWADTRHRFHVPRIYAEQLIDGVSTDLKKTRYTNFDELSAYCYSVASTVGLMSMHIVGFSGHEAIPYAIKLGIALQLTNILRDVGEDWGRGRLYLPQDEMAAFGLTERDIDTGNTGQRWQAFMHYQIKRNRRLYQESLPGIAMLNADGRFGIQAAAELYQAILDDIEAHQGNVFNRRAFVSTTGKLKRLPGIWLRSRLSSNEPR